jgi:hypothetical protein
MGSPVGYGIYGNGLEGEKHPMGYDDRKFDYLYIIGNNRWDLGNEYNYL